MSEHCSIKGFVDFWHLPYREKNGFTACQHCLKNDCFSDKLQVEFHEGWLNDWMKVVCARCKKTIWVANLQGRRKMIKDNLKCHTCGKPTNHYDSVISGGLVFDKSHHWCSKKCYRGYDKESREIVHHVNELQKCIEEQGLEYDGMFVFKLAKKIWEQKEEQK